MTDLTPIGQFCNFIKSITPGERQRHRQMELASDIWRLMERLERPLDRIRAMRSLLGRVCPFCGEIREPDKHMACQSCIDDPEAARRILVDLTHEEELDNLSYK